MMDKGVHSVYRWWAMFCMVVLLTLGNALPVAAAGPQPGWQSAGLAPAKQSPVPKPKPGDGAGGEDAAPGDELVEEQAADDTLAVTNLDDVESAVVQIEAVGTFADPADRTIKNSA